MEKNIPLEQAPPSYISTQQQNPNQNQAQPLIVAQPQFVQVLPNVLGMVPSMATCPNCGVRRKTKVEFEPSAKTHLLAMLICLVGGICCCCIPYCSPTCQSAKHTCESCGAYVGIYKN
ncbi:lipopolysaccharide-induced tumor necrosis factor-alpha factor homolog [Drosophila elegans]|uniref:lipopolysaccharide-induced tumor necrosis factor-alpha factor homolog n=1 Tax=Drosophila elegans TaxID=30023 RepID=UPI0007E6089B|nr:lipopolysaccharide-induced tumor necrosis factor-alpha factor homolog [Drosophila elegans]